MIDPENYYICITHERVCVGNDVTVSQSLERVQGSILMRDEYKPFREHWMVSGIKKYTYCADIPEAIQLTLAHLTQ